MKLSAYLLSAATILAAWAAPAQVTDPRIAAPEVELSAHPDAPVLKGLQPLSVRGMNYYPRLTPWDDFWIKTPVEVVARDMGLMNMLNVNTVRIFLPWNEAMEEAGLIEADGTVGVKYLARFESLMELAWRHRIRVVPCFTFGYHEKKPALPKLKPAIKALTTFVDKYSTDGRVLMWDVMNEPETGEWTPEETAWIKAALKAIEERDRNHLTTVGIAHNVEKLPEAGLPDVIQYHEYAPKVELWNGRHGRVKKSIDRMRKVGGDRPVLIGEFGSSTASDLKRGAGPEWLKKKDTKTESEEEQRLRYTWILQAAEKEQVAGAMAWCLHDYPTTSTGWLTPAESMFGLVRPDGSVKPAGEILRAYYKNWEAKEAKEPETVAPDSE